MSATIFSKIAIFMILPGTYKLSLLNALEFLLFSVQKFNSDAICHLITLKDAHPYFLVVVP